MTKRDMTRMIEQMPIRPILMLAEMSYRATRFWEEQLVVE